MQELLLELLKILLDDTGLDDSTLRRLEDLAQEVEDASD